MIFAVSPLPELEKLRNETKETVHLAILDQMEIVYIEKLQGLHAIGLMGSRVGGRSPAYCTGVGKVLLAYLDARVIKDYFLKRKLHRYTDNTITVFRRTCFRAGLDPQSRICSGSWGARV